MYISQYDRSALNMSHTSSKCSNINLMSKTSNYFFQPHRLMKLPVVAQLVQLCHLYTLRQLVKPLLTLQQR